MTRSQASEVVTGPDWLRILRPCADPTFGPIRPGSSFCVWHVAVSFQPFVVRPGAALTGRDTWNGKALVRGDDSGLETSFGEVELAARLQCNGAFARWTGRPREPWNAWALDAASRSGWFATVDGKIRRSVRFLEGHSRGKPDVVQWTDDEKEFRCVEYKGPSPSKPQRQDRIKKEQEDWLITACERQLLAPDRIAVVEWRPDEVAAHILRAQAEARRRGRSSR